ncbi:Inositol monophosphatase [Phytophthora megakarya]|uniref:inositol-phosphate phosphatase n=1 Tax=Phytophthora megakarya TaxID=4795 RepID=A0A225VIY1_9STRA|nr:Inositol monophosphatase [Phytophthora megakarya]
MLDVAIAAARNAGAHMKSQLSTSRVEKTKSSKDDLVTVVDKQCQDLVFDTIKQTFPTHEFLGEENVEPGSEASARALQDMVNKEWLWIVDPIDGTTNFVHHRPASVVSVACAHLGDVVVGVIYDPYRDELFTAQQGKGTCLNGQPVRVSHEASFSEALVGFGIGTKDSVRLPMLDCAREFSAKCRGLRLQGAAAIELAWTAAGRQSAFYELDLNSWDVAAGALLVKEAGGQVSNSDGTPFSWQQDASRYAFYELDLNSWDVAAGALLVNEAGGQVSNSDGTPFSLSTRNIVASNNQGDIHTSMIELIQKADAIIFHLATMEEQLPAPYHVNTWFFVCGPLAVNVFLLGLAANVYVFKKNRLAFDRVLDMRPDEVPTARGLFQTAVAMTLLQLLLFNGEAARRGDSFGVDETRMELLLLGYVLVAATLLLCPLDVLHYKFRMFLVRKLARCFWPFQQFSFKLPTHATPFIEVFIADGMTSLSKFIQDFSVATPYIIRATQCLISFQRTPSVNDRFLHLLNTMKYCSSLLVISVGAYPMLMGLARPEQSSFFLLCAVFNSMYSFLWDVVMDWGLGQPKLPRRVAFLRHQLTYRPRKIYYLVIVVDFVLRIMWVTKWWDWMHHGVHFKLVSQVAEVVRRVIWNFVRVEWQCIKLDILGTKKISADSIELEEVIEKMPLMQDVEDDSMEDTKARMRTLSRPNSFSAASCTETSSTLSQSPVHESNGKELLLQVMRDAGTAQDEIIAPAAVTVASYPDKPQAMLINGGDHAASTHRRESSQYKMTTSSAEGAEVDEM